MNTTEAEFGMFWTHYPKKKSKGDAYKAWLQTASKRPDLKTVLQALIVLKGSPEWTKDDGTFIPYPATWLRAWGWADVPEADKADVKGGQLWWMTSSGIEARGKELGLAWDAVNGETFLQYRDRVKDASDSRKVVPVLANVNNVNHG